MNPVMTRRRMLGALSGALGWIASRPAAHAAKAAVQNLLASSHAPKGYDPTKHKWLMCIDVERCIGCGLCVDACKRENHVPEASSFFRTDRKSTRLNSSHLVISYAVLCLKKKK